MYVCIRTKWIIPKVKSSHITTGADERRQSEKVNVCSTLGELKSLIKEKHG